LDSFDDSFGQAIPLLNRRVKRAEFDNELIKIHLVGDPHAGLGGKPFGHLACDPAVTLDHLYYALAAQRLDHRPCREAARSARKFRH
jgi:hypothetical protein